MKVKQLMAVAAATLIAVGAYAQGQLLFQNGSGAKVYVTNNGAIQLPAPFVNGTLCSNTYGMVFGLYFSLNTNAIPNPHGSADGFTLVAGTANSSAFLQGQFAGGSRAIPGADGGAYVIVQVRAWNNPGTYSSYEEAVASGLATEVVGYSIPTILSLGGGTTSIGVPNLYGGTPVLTPFFVSPVPEPSIMALGALGLLGVLFIRRRK
jgi:hypothetical protein